MKFYLFTSIDTLTYSSNDISVEQLLTVSEEYGMSDTVFSKSVYLSEAMNGQELYAEIIAETQESLDQMGEVLSNAPISTRDDWDTFITTNFPIHEEGDAQDSYFITVEKEQFDMLLQQANKNS